MKTYCRTWRHKAALALLTALPLGGLAAAETIIPDTVTPLSRYNDAPNWELGTIFRATVPGKITHIRVFSLGEESGDHQVRLWRNADNTLVAGPVTWTFGGNESWITLDIPDVALVANEDYTISISAPAEGWYPANSQYFSAPGDNGMHLAFPEAAGVFSDTPGNRPTQSYGNGNYLRDIVFEAESTFPMITVLGNGVAISPGSTTPNFTDGTQFGGIKINGGTLSRTFTISNPGLANLVLDGTPLVVIGGAQANEFSLTTSPVSPVPPGGSTTFTLQFAPTASGLREASVILTNNAGAPFQFALAGIGLGTDYRTLGNQTGTSALTITADQVIGNRFMALRNMQVSQLNVKIARLTATSGEAVLKGAIYADNTSGPTFLGGTLELVNPTNGWHTLALTQPVNVGAGSNYWLVVWARADQVELYGDATGRLQWGTYIYGGNWPDPADLSSGSSTATLCLYTEGMPTDATGPEMEVQGNGLYVAAGATNVSTANGTDFGTVMLFGGTREFTYKVLNVGLGTLSLNGTPVATLTGPNASDFTIVTQPASSVTSGGSSDLKIRFTPTAASPRTATVSIPQADSPSAYQFTIQGAGLYPPGAAVLGNDGVGTDSRLNDAAHITGNRFMAPGDLRLTELRAKVVALMGSFACAVYGDNNGVPGPLLASTVAVAFPTNGWNTFALNSPLNIAGGSYYWLLIWTDTASAALQADTMGTAFIGNYSTFDFPNWPEPVNLTPITWETRTYCIYAEGTPLTAATGPQMNLRGNDKLIVCGDTTPNTLDGTDFGSWKMSGGALLLNFTIQNSGGSPLLLTGNPVVAITGPQAGDFQVLLPPASTIAPGASTTFSLRFAPSAAGLCSASVSIANNDVNPNKNPYSFAVRGAGLAVGRETIFPDSKVGADVDNDGTAYALGTIFQCSVPGAITQLRVFSVAGDYGDHTAYIFRNFDAAPVGGPYTWNFGGVTGWIYLDIPPVDLDIYTDYTVSISTGTGPMRNYANIAADVGDGGNNGLNLSYPPNAGVFLENNLDAMPTKTWNASSYLRDIVFVPSTNTFPLPVMTVWGNGNLIPDGYSSPDPTNFTDFGSMASGGGWIEHAFTITNTGNGPLNLIGAARVAITGPQADDFTVVTPPAAFVAPGAANTFTIRFSPGATGLRRALVAIENNDKNPYYFALAGTGTAALQITSIAVDPATGNVTLQWDGPGQTLQVERASSVAGPYHPIGELQTATSYTDPGIMRTNPSAFYRLK